VARFRGSHVDCGPPPSSVRGRQSSSFVVEGCNEFVGWSRPCWSSRIRFLRSWSPVDHHAAATGEKSGRKGMTRGASMSAVGRERTGASGPTWRCWARQRGAGRARESEGSAGARGPRARVRLGRERGRREATRMEFCFLFQKCEIVFSFVYFVVNYLGLQN
jgi:hypothetical protein